MKDFFEAILYFYSQAIPIASVTTAFISGMLVIYSTAMGNYEQAIYYAVASAVFSLLALLIARIVFYLLP